MSKMMDVAAVAEAYLRANGIDEKSGKRPNNAQIRAAVTVAGQLLKATGFERATARDVLHRRYNRSLP